MAGYDRKTTKLILPFGKFSVDILLRPEAGAYIDAFAVEGFHNQQRILLAACIKDWDFEVDGKKVEVTPDGIRKLDMEDYMYLVRAVDTEASKMKLTDDQKKTSG